MKTNIIGFFATIIPMLILDGIWLSIMIRGFYLKHLGNIFSAKPLLAPAVVFYILYCIGVVYFVVLPLFEADAGLWTVFLTGAFLGLIAYAAYDLTNQSTLKEWTTLITVVDLAWGAFITGVSSVVAVSIMKMMKLM